MNHVKSEGLKSSNEVKRSKEVEVNNKKYASSQTGFGVITGSVKMRLSRRCGKICGLVREAVSHEVIL